MDEKKEPININIEDIKELCENAEVAIMATSNGVYVNGNGASILTCLSMLIDDLIENGVPKSAIQLVLLHTLNNNEGE